MRQIIAALLLTLGLASPALAAVCTPTPALPDTERRTEYAGIVAQTGPFNVGFQLYGDSTDYGNWLSVWVNGVALTAVTDYTVTSPSGPLANLCRPISDAQVTFTAAQTGTIEIEGSQRPRRTSQVSENAGVTARTFNQVISTLTAELRERWDRQSRLVRSPPGETLSVLPPAATRASKFLFFDSAGNTSLASPSPGLGNVVGPASTTVGHLVTWANAGGTLLADGGTVRTQLTTNITIFVNGSTGSDTANTGLTAGSPFLTPQKAFSYLCNNLDLAGKAVLVDLSDAGAFTGTYSGGFAVCGYIGYTSGTGQSQVTIQGAAARSATCVGYPTLSGGITGVSNGFPWTFKNLQINGQTQADAGTFIAHDGNCFGTTAGPHNSAVNAGSKIEFVNNPYTINGPATGGHVQASFGGEIIYQSIASPVTITGTPNMGGQFAYIALGGSLNCQDVTFTGALAAVTKKYVVDSKSSIQCGKTSVSNDPNTVLPGDTTGTGLGVSGQLLSSSGPGNDAAFNNLDSFITVSAPITKSGTSTVNLACGSCLSVAATGHGDSIYTILSTDRYVYTTAALTAPRIWTLPAANSIAAGSTIMVVDAASAASSTNTISVARAGADTIDGGATSIVISSAGGGSSFTSDGVSNWGYIVVAPSQGGTGRNTLTNHGVLVGAGIAPITQLSVGATGTVLQGATGADPSFVSASQLPGTTTNDSATAGNIGEFLSSQGTNGSSTVTITNASPGVVSWTSHGLNIGSPVNFTTTGGLPTGLSVGTNYYVSSQGFGANSFSVSTSVANALGGTSINTSSAGSGTHTALSNIILATGVAANVTGMNLTAGDWDVWVNGVLGGGATTTVNFIQASTSVASASLSGLPGPTQNTTIAYGQTPFSFAGHFVLNVGPARLSVASTTTVFLVVNGSFGVSTMSAYGTISARRRR